MGDAVLIAAFSARALAQSARRAGYQPLVVDAFGDLDTQEAAEDFRILDGAMRTGFKTKPVIVALDALASASKTPPIGLVLGSGFEDKPMLVAALAKRYRLLGSSPETIAACKDPRKFFALLDELGIAHPETRVEPPDDPQGWISKRIGGSGGRHIRVCTARSRTMPRRYFQEQLAGERISVGGVFAPDHSTLAVTRQWIAPSPQHPFRFGGAVSLPHFDQDLYQHLTTAATRVATALGLVGMVSFDFIVTDGLAQLLEVNARPGASLDVLDDDRGNMFRAHVAAALGGPAPAKAAPAKSAHAMAILHADRAALTLGDTPWPEWSADRGSPGTFVPQGAPLASVFASGPTADAAEALARARLAELEDLIYGHAKH